MASILVVDDSSFQRDQIGRLLARDSHTVTKAGDGNSALRLLLEGDFDCVLLDLVMPELDGFGLLEALSLAQIDVPVIVVTADIQKTTRDRCLGLGAVDVIPKPTNPEALKKALAGTLDRKQASAGHV